MKHYRVRPLLGSENLKRPIITAHVVTRYKTMAIIFILNEHHLPISTAGLPTKTAA